MASVLLLDADQRRARLASWALEPHHSVEAVESIEAAADRGRATKADVVIFNTLLYEGDQSDELLRAITSGPNEPPRVIVIEEPGTISARAIPAVIDAVITSPFDADDLLTTLNEVLLKPYE